MSGNFFGGQFFGGGFFGQSGAGVRGKGAKRPPVIRMSEVTDRESTAEFLKAQLSLRNPFEPIPESEKPKPFVAGKSKKALAERAKAELEARNIELYNENMKKLILMAVKK